MGRYDKIDLKKAYDMMTKEEFDQFSEEWLANNEDEEIGPPSARENFLKYGSVAILAGLAGFAFLALYQMVTFFSK